MHSHRGPWERRHPELFLKAFYLQPYPALNPAREIGIGPEYSSGRIECRTFTFLPSRHNNPGIFFLLHLFLLLHLFNFFNHFGQGLLHGLGKRIHSFIEIFCV